MKQALAGMELNCGVPGLLQLVFARPDSTYATGVKRGTVRARKQLAAALQRLWIISAAPSLAVFVMQGGFLTNTQHNLAYVWPPSQVPDFAIGVVAGT